MIHLVSFLKTYRCIYHYVYFRLTSMVEWLKVEYPLPDDTMWVVGSNSIVMKQWNSTTKKLRWRWRAGHYNLWLFGNRTVSPWTKSSDKNPPKIPRFLNCCLSGNIHWHSTLQIQTNLADFVLCIDLYRKLKNKKYIIIFLTCRLDLRRLMEMLFTVALLSMPFISIVANVMAPTMKVHSF